MWHKGVRWYHVYRWKHPVRPYRYSDVTWHLKSETAPKFFFSTASSGKHQRKHQSSTLLSLCERNPLRSVDSLHKGRVRHKVYPSHDVNLASIHPPLILDVHSSGQYTNYEMNITSGPIFCLLPGVSSGCAQPITGQVTSVTWPVIGWA